MDYGPIPQCQIPPVVHSVYVPNKPRVRTNTNQNLAQIDTHLELIQRQHSYNAVDYDLQRRIKVQQQARSQLLSENPSFNHLLDEHGKPISSAPLISPVPRSTSIPLNQLSNPKPHQSTTLPFTPSLYSGNETPSDIDQHRSTQQPQRRAFGEMMRDGGFMAQRQDQTTTTTTTTPTPPGHNVPQPTANLHKTELSNSDSFVMIEDQDDTHNKTKTTQIKAPTNQKGVTVNKNGLKLFDNKKPPSGSAHKQLLCSNVLHTSHGVDLLLAEPGHDVALMSVDVIKYLQRGISVIKHGRSGKPHTCLLKLSQNCRYFVWDSKNKEAGENVIRFTWISKIEQGQTSLVFQRNVDPRVEAHSLSIVYSRPEKYTHVDNSDDENESTGHNTSSSFLPSFFKRGDDKGGSGAGKRSTWKGVNQDFTFDLVIEDPNDWLIWYNGAKMLTDMASNKAISDRSVRLTKKTAITLQLPILSDYPSSAWIVDHQSGLTVAEQQENERHREQNQVQVQVALTRKETFKELVRRTSSYNGGSQSNIRSYLANQQQSQGGSTPGTTAAALPDQTNPDELDLLAQSFPSPWKSIEIAHTSDIVHHSWLQQIIYYGPKNGRSCPWVRAYTMSTTAATYSRIIDRIKHAPLEELGIVPEKINPDLSAQEVARRQRAYQSWYNLAGSLSILILRTKGGDVIGGFATAPWTEKWGFYGSPDSFVFSIGQEHVTIEPPPPGSPEAIAAAAANPQVMAIEEKIFQAHIYRWCGVGRYFQFVSRDAIGFGSNPTDENAQDGAAGESEWKNDTNAAGAEDGNANPTGSKPMQLAAPQTTGPALTLDKSFETGYSQPCPIFHSPQLTKEKQFKCLQLEVWVPIPKI